MHWNNSSTGRRKGPFFTNALFSMSFLCVSVVQNKATKELSEPIHISKTWKESSSGKGKAQGCARNNCLETWCARGLTGLSVGARNKWITLVKTKEYGLKIRKFANSRSQVSRILTSRIQSYSNIRKSNGIRIFELFGPPLESIHILKTWREWELLLGRFRLL